MGTKTKEVAYLVSTADTGYFYTVMKKRKGVREKLELMKYDPIVKKHVLFKEGKLKKIKK